MTTNGKSHPHDGDNLLRLENVIRQLRHWQPWIEEALVHARHTHTFDDIVGMILQNRVLFFPYDDCFLVMEKVVYPQFATFHCFLAGGEMEAVISHEAEMREIGQKLDCKYLSIAGRKGWLRQLERRGWRHVSSAMFLPIGEPEDEWRRREGRGAENDSRTPRGH